MMGLGFPNRLSPLALWGVMLVCAGCSMRVIPPAGVKDPVTVRVVDYGRHAGLVLPEEPGKLVEFSWGDWNFFALAHTDICSGLRAVLFSGGSTLSHKVVEDPGSPGELVRRLRAERVITFAVERAEMEKLREELTRRYRKHIETEVYNEKYKTFFVRDDKHYWLLDNCTHETARWVKELGCGVKGWSLMSEFVLPKDVSTRPAP